MVATTLWNSGSAVSSVKTLLLGLGKHIAEVNFEEKEYEYRIDVQPASEKHCYFWLSFSNYGTYGLCFGHGSAFEDLSLVDFPPDDVTRAILKGQVSETVWEFCGRVTRVTGRISFVDGRLLQDKTLVHPLGLLGIGKSRTIHYEPYPTDQSATGNL